MRKNFPLASISNDTSIRSYVLLIILLFLFPFNGIGSVSINQIGYPPHSPKYLFVAQPTDSFDVVDVESGTSVFKDRFQLWRTNDPSTGLTLYRGEFSSLEQPGLYSIHTSDGEVSQHFSIRESVYCNVHEKSLKGFYFQRCGMELSEEYAGVYAHPACHSWDGFFHSSTDTAGFHPARGGWHDAGDYGKYVVNAGITVGTLLMAYELFPDRFGRDDLSIPESGNGVPDILDEARYELEWLLLMQGPSGGVYHKLTREQFSPFLMPQSDTERRYTYEISTTATGNYTAVMAKAARLFLSFDSTFSQDCLAAAEDAWAYLESHPQIVPAGGFQNPEGTNTGQYGDTQDFDERLWAAIELYMTTGEAEYHDYYRTYYDEQGMFTGAMSWRSVTSLAHITYLTGARNDIDASIQSQLRSSLEGYCQQLVEERNNNGFHVLLKPGQYNWGCHSAALNRAILLIIGYHEIGNEEYYDVALDQLHYILGANAHGISFVTGVGSISVMHPHHRPSGSDGIEDPVPGLLAGGPNEYLQDPILASRFDSSTPPALCYVDEEESYASNEIAINWNAPLVFVAGYFGCEQYGGERGDVDGSGDIDVLDVLAVVNHILGILSLSGEPLSLADCNGDGDVNVIDALGIVNVILGVGECA